MSIKPGVTIQPASPAITSAPSTGSDLPIRAMRPSSIRTSNSPSRPFAGSTTRPPLQQQLHL
jgi:hypothetical protein